MLDLIEPGRPVSVERDTFPRLVAAGRMYAVATDDYWIDAGRPELFLQANLDLVTGVAAASAPRPSTPRPSSPRASTCGRP